MSDPTLFEREVEEDLRQDRIAHLWRSYGPPTLIGIVVALAAGAGYIYYEDRQAAAKANAAAAYATAVETLAASPGSKAVARLEALDDAPGAYSALARLNRAQVAADAAEIDAAVALYESVERDPDTDRLLRDLAALKASYLQADREDPEAFAARVERQRRQDNAWLPFVKELAALADLERGYRAGAQAAFAALSLDSDAPQGLRNRAKQLAQSLAPPQTGAGLEGLEAAPAAAGSVSNPQGTTGDEGMTGDDGTTGDDSSAGEEGDDDGA
ncbi:MAG: tetratricopeptide repeat protein [Alphaproteobacteria bacterium]